jgi:hypothetical protein
LRRVKASRLTPAGRSWLQQSRQARILHVFEAVCNLINNRGVVLSVQFDEIPASPVSLALSAQALGLPVGGGFGSLLNRDSEVDIHPGGLRLDELEILWNEADLWDPAPNWSTMRAQQASWLPQLQPLIPILLTEAPANSLAPLLAPKNDSSQKTGSDFLAEKILARARPAAERLQAAIRADEQVEAQAAAAALAGLGGGLTPSGDDYLMGVMHALWATLAEQAAAEWSEYLSQPAADRTGPLSATWLRAAALGQATGSWHRLFSDLLVGKTAHVHATTRMIMQIGHSSGADGLAGFIHTLS